MDERPKARTGWWRARGRSFGYAARGLGFCLATQPNARIHLVATIAAVAMGFFLGLAIWEWCAVVAVIALVWTAETFNTALENLVDLVSPEWQPLAGRIKDLAAGAVLAASLGALVIGALLFGPKLWTQLFR